jgi:ElaB/YqjD/DUF883 family membrane-anchored ribosome-binding protein
LPEVCAAAPGRLSEPPIIKLESAMNSTSTLTENIPAAAEDAVARTAQSAHEIVDRVAEKAGPAIDRMREGVGAAADAIQGSAEELGEMQQRWLAACRSCVRDYPFASIAVAVAAGVVLSRLLLPRDGDDRGGDRFDQRDE